MKFDTINNVLSEKAHVTAEEYQMGLPIAEYSVVFTYVDVMRIVLQTCVIIFALIFLVKSFLLIKNPEILGIMYLFLVGIDVAAILVLIFYHLVWLLYQRQRCHLKGTISLLVCTSGILSIKRGQVEIIYWQQIVRYKIWRMYFYTQVALHLSNGRVFYVKNVFPHFKNFIENLKENVI